MKRAIFTFYNLSLDVDVVKLQQEVVVKFNTTAKFFPLLSKTHGEQVIHPDAVDYGFNQLFVEEKYDTVLLLDVDCIPLNKYALEYTFEEAEKGKLVGNVQRGMHLDNDEHNYVAPSAFCLTRQMYEDFGKRTVKPDHVKFDCCGDYTYEAEKRGIEVEMYQPSHFQRRPKNAIWDLGKGRGEWGIGTTYSNHLGVEMFYHLFSAREKTYNVYFYEKCEEVLGINRLIGSL